MLHKTKVDQAAKQVEQGAKQIGHGSVGPGVKQTAKGIGNTVVEGAKFSGENIKEFFSRTSSISSSRSSTLPVMSRARAGGMAGVVVLFFTWCG